MALICSSVKHAAGVLRKRGHRSSWNSVGGDATNSRIVGDREVNRGGKSDRSTALSIEAMAPGAVLCVEEAEVHHRVGGINCEFATGRPGALSRVPQAVVTSIDATSMQRGELSEASSAFVLSWVFVCQSGGSKPIRSASGKCCHVRMRPCQETTMPATIQIPPVTPQTTANRCAG